MANNHVVPNGVRRIAPSLGVPFNPTNEVLISTYLRRKVQGLPFHPLEYTQIPEANIFTTDPWLLEGNPLHARYFFSTRDDNRTTNSGVWRDSGVNEQINNSENQVIGSKRTYDFFINDDDGTNWKLHEYTLDNAIQGWDTWVVCKLLFVEADSSSESSDTSSQELEIVLHQDDFTD